MEVPSNVHLWYHGSIDWATPTSDTGASLTGVERANWWTGYEDYGAIAGFYYSLIGRGDRLSSDQPLGPGFGAIRDGYNQYWDLGAGTSVNRTALTSNNGKWTNLIKFNRTDTNQVVQGQSTTVKYYYQWALPSTSSGTISIYLDDDMNPLNANQKLLKQISILGNGASYVSYGTVNIALDSTNAAPGWHALFAKIVGGGQTRYLYAPELVGVISNQQPPKLDISRISGSQVQVTVHGSVGQTVVLHGASSLSAWQALATNTLSSDRWVYLDTIGGTNSRRFYRALLLH